MTAPPIREAGPLPAWVPAARFPFRRRVAEIAGCQVHFVDEGEGPPLLLLHGNPTWSFLYRDLIAGLRAQFRCIAPDYPGFGLSTAPPGYDFRIRSHAAVLEELVRALGLRGVTMMVQDWGGPIGLTVATRQPERFRALVIGNTFAWPVGGDLHFELFSRLVGGPLGRVLIRRANFFVRVLLPAGMKRHTLTPEEKRAYEGPFPTAEAREPVAVMPREILAARPLLGELEAGLERLRDLPALIVWGDGDFAFRARERARFEQLFPRHQTVVLEGAGHYIQEDAPDEIVRAIRAFWPTVA